MKITIPELALIVLVGPSGSGKSTFARAHFRPTEVLSSDACRALVADDENDQSATKDAFELLHFIAAKRLAAGRLTVVDATNVQPDARRPLVALARTYHCPAVALVLNLPERLCQERNRSRPDRDFGPHVVRRQCESLRRSLRGLKREGFGQVEVLDSPDAVEAVTFERTPLRPNRHKSERGPFDIIGDVHGCLEELTALLGLLGYKHRDGAYRHSEGRRVVFIGDLVDRGPNVPGVLRLAMAMVAAGTALCVPGNHDDKLVRALRGRDVQIAHGLEVSLAQLAAESPTFKDEIAAFLDGSPTHLVLDGGALVVAHAGMKEEMQGRASNRVRDFALYGETSGETDEFGLPIRYNWAAEYRGTAIVVYGHTPVPDPQWLNQTINIDTGCVFGGRLTALRYPERELVTVPAARVYAEPARPFPTAPAPVLSAQQQHDELLDIEDVSGKRRISTRLHGEVTIGEEQSIAALEVMSRFAANPKWLIYLPPTMSPCETAPDGELLEHPAQAFAYFRQEGITSVLCEEKHMGSRAVVVVCRDEQAAQRHFGVSDEGRGIVYTRTGRRFFDDPALEAALLARLDAALERAGLWERLSTDWLLLDCELLPWSAKAQELLRRQYAGVGAAGAAALTATVSALAAAEARGLDVAALLIHTRERAAMLDRYIAAYRRYCWPVNALDDFKLAPFHLLAGEHAVYADQDHIWHMATLGEVCAADLALLLATPYRQVDLADPASEAAATAWWEELTARGGEGMVVKPLSFIAQGRRGLAQPAVKCRGREYLRIIYGPEYTAPDNLSRLRPRKTGAKRALALREFALGLEGLERFARREPLRRVHECAFGVLALESEPVDPRL